MSITADTASLSYPDAYGNALKDKIRFTNAESNAEWFANRVHFARPTFNTPQFFEFSDTRSSDVGRGLALFFVYQAIDASWASKFFRLSAYPDASDRGEIKLPPLKRLGVIKGNWSKPKRIRFVPEFLD